MAGRLPIMPALLAALLACSNSAPPPRAEERCCNCLVSGQTPRNVPCLSLDAGAMCVASLDNDVPLETSPSCLRDVCGSECEPLGFRPASRSTLQTCCECLAVGEDQNGLACFSDGVETCTNALDDGMRLVTSEDCLETTCRNECGFLERSAPDGG